MTDDSRRIIDSLYDAYNRHDAAAVARLYAPGATHQDIAQSSARNGPNDIAEGLAHFFTAFPDAHWEPRERVIDDRQAAITYVLTGTLKGRLGPFEPRSQALKLRGAHVLRIADGLIEASEDYWDSGTFGRQMASSVA